MEKIGRRLWEGLQHKGKSYSQHPGRWATGRPNLKEGYRHFAAKVILGMDDKKTGPKGQGKRSIIRDLQGGVENRPVGLA